MNVWKYLLAASLGNMIAGPLGALAFTAGAYFLGKKNNFRNPGANFNTPVSYTHLTLPTIYSV